MNKEHQETGRGRPGRVIWLLFTASVAVNYALIAYNRHLETRIDTMKRAFGLFEGRFLSTAVFRRAADGGVEAFSFVRPKPTIIYVFSPTCGWCKRNQLNMKSLAYASRSAFDFIAVSGSCLGVGRYAATHALPVPVYCGSSNESSELIVRGGTPQTVVVSTSGQVVRHWIGAYTGTVKDAIEGCFGVRLPGLAAGQ